MLKKLALIAFAAVVINAAPASAQSVRIDGGGVRVGVGHSGHHNRGYHRGYRERHEYRGRHHSRHWDRGRHRGPRIVIKH